MVNSVDADETVTHMLEYTFLASPNKEGTRTSPHRNSKRMWIFKPNKSALSYELKQDRYYFVDIHCSGILQHNS